MIIPQFVVGILHNLPVVHLLIILSAFLLTYIRIFGKDYFVVIDDLEGIQRYAETWNDKEQKKNDSYVLDGKTKKFLEFIPELGFPGNIFRFIRLQIGKQFKVIGKNAKGHDVWGFGQSPRRHHMINVVVQILNLTMGYVFLRNIMPEWMAFGACLLYAVHPLTTSSVAWISGYNYNFSMFFSLALLNVALTFHVPELKYIFVALLSFLSTITIYTGAFTCIPLWFLGLRVEAVIAGLVGFGLIAWKGMEVKNMRVKAFKEQNMAHSTFLHPRKIIVMLKTLWYYMRVVFLPMKMGLYHTWGYFYEEPIERIDRMFWLGILTLGVFLCLIFSGVPILAFGAVWFLAYLFLFSNFITAQQFVADRYAMVPSFGICILLTYFLYHTPIFWVILGLYAMRTYLHLPTFKNEIDYYASNFMNFRKSEVSLGNLGVAFINQGMHGAAVDTWMLSTKINPHYDVPWYNLYSVFKGNGRLDEAKGFLQKCLDAKIVHFDKKWADEMAELDKQIEFKKMPVTPTEVFYHEAADHYKAKDLQREYQALQKFMQGSTEGLIQDMISQVKARLVEIESSGLLRDYPVSGQSGPQVTGFDPVDPSAGVSAGSN